MKNFLWQTVEEFFPFIIFIINKWKILNTFNQFNTLEDNDKYLKLDEESLKNRLSEEHNRASQIDDKTSKFTLALSLSLTILTAVSGAFLKFLPSELPLLAKSISIICLLSSSYMLIASTIALSSYKTLPKYGYGTNYLLQLQETGKKVLAKNLYLQEKMNIIRHIRNEATYQCIRNGLLLLLIAFIATLIYLSVNLIFN